MEQLRTFIPARLWREAVVAAAVAEDEALVVHAQPREDRGVDVVDVDRIGDDRIAEVVGLAVDLAAAGAAAVAGLPHDPKLDGVNLSPFVTGENKSAPHDTLYWRWGSQAAILEMPYKLVALGDRERLLFDLTKPDGENIERNLIKQHPEIAARLETKLKAWAATLMPPGLPATFDAHHEGLFAEHDLIPKAQYEAIARKSREPEGSINGWICRNGTLAVNDGALTITPEANLAKNARVFLTHSGLDLAGPVIVIMRVRAKQGGEGAFTWRTKLEKDFVVENSVSFKWPTSDDWQDLKAELPVKGRLIHLRISPAKDSAGLEVQSITIAPPKDEPSVFQFNKPQASP